MMVQAGLGTVAALLRYPVKSMMGENLGEAELTERGLQSDRVQAIVDGEDGSIVSAKKWPRLLELRSGLTEDGVRITLPGGEVITSLQDDCGAVLSRALGRKVTLRSGEGFHDCAVVHLLTTATLERLRALAPGGRFDPRRFRPNVVIDTAPGLEGFVENDWIGRTLALGGEVLLRVTKPCERCVMTTLPQDDLPADPGILRAAARHNRAHVGVYADVLRGGAIRRGDPVALA